MHNTLRRTFEDWLQPAAASHVRWICIALYAVVAFYIVRALWLTSSLGVDLLLVVLTLVVEGCVPGVIGELMIGVLRDEVVDQIPVEAMEVSAHLSLTITASLMALSQGLVVLFGGPTIIWESWWTRFLWAVILVVSVLAIATALLATRWFVNYKAHGSKPDYIKWVYPNMVRAPMNYYRITLGTTLFLALVIGGGLI